MTASRVVLSGLGQHAIRTVLPTIDALGSVELVAVVSARPGAAAELGESRGVAAYGSLEDALADQQPDLVYISSVPSRHAADAVTAIVAGVPSVVCEKPLASTGAAAVRLCDQAADNDVLLVEALAYQFHPQFAAIRAAIAQELGGLRHGYARFSYPHRDPADHRYSPAAGGGAFLDAGAYPVSMAIALLGSDATFAHFDRRKGVRDVDTSGAATLENQAGHTFQCSWEMGSAYTNFARLVGTDASLEIPRPFSKPATFAEPLRLTRSSGETGVIDYRATNHFAEMIDSVAAGRSDRDFVESMRQETKGRWSLLGEVLG